MTPDQFHRAGQRLGATLKDLAHTLEWRRRDFDDGHTIAWAGVSPMGRHIVTFAVRDQSWDGCVDGSALNRALTVAFAGPFGRTVDVGSLRRILQGNNPVARFP